MKDFRWKMDNETYRDISPGSPMIPNSILEYLITHAEQNGERTAIICGDQSISYSELIERSTRFGGALQALGITHGDRVALVMADGPEWVVAFLGIIGQGAIAVLCSTMLKATELVYVLNDSGAKAAIITPEQSATLLAVWENAPALQKVLLACGEASPKEKFISFEQLLEAAPPVQPSAPAEIDPETPACILYTSGSTGEPKGAVHRHSDFPFGIEKAGRNLFEVTPDDRLFSSSRLFFAYGLGNSLSLPLGLGATSILCRERPTPPVIAEVFARYKPTIFFAVPAVFRALLEYRRNGNTLETSSIRFCVSAGESLPAQIYNDWKEATGLDTIDAIGSTELLYMFISNRRDCIRPGSSGLPIEGYEARLLDNNGRVIEGAGRGDLYVKGASALLYYWNKPEKTAETIRDGWVKTGDVYRRDEEGFYWFEGRSDDIFKSSGMWVSPGEVEEALCTHSAVLEAAVIPELDEDGTNLTAAYIVLRPDETAGTPMSDALKQHAATLLPRYKQPKRIYFLDQLPRTATGKLQRYKLRK
ncbi:MAG: benzoate-CoA ligase family protein [Acidobacteria bacterium]|nr:benzoate-CoA ligase family protein [Acidobacteriota bacterium]